jgi:hypothetical protein
MMTKKDDLDFFYDVLRGESVSSDVNPETILEAQNLRNALCAIWQEKRQSVQPQPILPSLQEILKDIEISLSDIWLDCFNTEVYVYCKGNDKDFPQNSQNGQKNHDEVEKENACLRCYKDGNDWIVSFFITTKEVKVVADEKIKVLLTIEDEDKNVLIKEEQELVLEDNYWGFQYPLPTEFVNKTQQIKKMTVVGIITED